MPTPVITLWETDGSTMADVATRVGEILGITVHPQWHVPAGTTEPTEAVLDGLADANTEAVTSRAAAGGVIPGRNAAFILQDWPGALHVKLDGIAGRRTVEKPLPWDPRDIESYDAIVNTAGRDAGEIAAFIAVMARVRSGQA